jgi:hypothetical protein
MVLLSCSGTGGGIYAKLANGVAQYNCAQVSPPTVHWRYDFLRVVNKRIIANALTERPDYFLHAGTDSLGVDCFARRSVTKAIH